jgi:hypothetical protein
MATRRHIARVAREFQRSVDAGAQQPSATAAGAARVRPAKVRG